MKFEQLYSGSAANLYMVTASNGKRLMIECGIAWKNLMRALNHDLRDIVGCLLTHEHADHSKAVKSVILNGIDVFASEGTFKALGLGLDMRRVRLITDKTIISCCSGFTVMSFAVNHDAAEPLGFIIRDMETGEDLLFVTDTSHIKQQFDLKFDIIAIECSYNLEYLEKRVEAKTIHEEVAKRLLTSHMEEKETMRYLAEFCDLSKCREIHLLHMSADNINKERIQKDFEKRFFIQTRTVESASTCSM